MAGEAAILTDRRNAGESTGPSSPGADAMIMQNKANFRKARHWGGWAIWASPPHPATGSGNPGVFPTLEHGYALCLQMPTWLD